MKTLNVPVWIYNTESLIVIVLRESLVQPILPESARDQLVHRLTQQTHENCATHNNVGKVAT